MAQSGDDSYCNSSGNLKDSRSSIMSDSAFTATPMNNSTPNGSRSPEPAAKPGNSFMQNLAATQRSPVTVKEHGAALSRKLSVKSNGSHGSNDTVPGVITGVLQTIHQGQENLDRGRERGDSTSSIIEATNQCSLSKSNSEKSAKSVRSYQSLRGIGTFQVGSLRVHSPSPTRSPTEETHPCLEAGDIFVVRDIPVGVVVGYDTKAITIEKEGKFEGFKYIGPGAHLIWASPTTDSVRTGYWIMTPKKASDEFGETIVKRWDKYNEVLDEEASVAEARIQRQSIPEYVDKLFEYDLSSPATYSSDPAAKKDTSHEEIWRSLTCCMKGVLLTEITGKPWNEWQVSSIHDYKRHSNTSLDRKSTLDFEKDQVLAFIFPKDSRTFSTESLGRERTEQAMDTTAHIDAIVSGRCKFEDSDLIIGEMQFCFVTGLLLGNHACMEHWAHIVKTVFKAYRYAVLNPDFFEKFITAFHCQLMYDEGAFPDESILDIDPNLRDDLKVIFTIFKSRLTEQLLAQGNTLTNPQKAVGTAFEKLESWLWKWGWDLRGNYLRKGNYQLEDGTIIEDLETSDMEAEDERGRQNSSSHQSSSSFSRFRKNSSRLGVKFEF